MSKERPVAVVTGASRGAGKGIAQSLGDAGYVVYVTGRTRHEGDSSLPGTVEATAAQVTARGGLGVPVFCDHGKDEQVQELFAQVEREQSGRLDVLVNNACLIPEQLTEAGGFWEKPLDLLEILKVGMRSHYVASYYAAPLMVARGSGLIVHTSSFGGRCYMHGPAYGAGKAAVDKMASDMAVELRPHGVAVVSIWMGLVSTERTLKVVSAEPEKYGPLMETMETPRFTGKLVVALASDPQLMERSGQILVGAELAMEYGILDEGDKQPPSHRPMLGGPAQSNSAVVR